MKKYVDILDFASPFWLWDLEIPVQVPAIETCFMSIDEILVVRIFSKSQCLYYKRRAQNFSISQSLRKYEYKLYSKEEEAWNFSKSQNQGRSSEFFWVPGIWRNMKHYKGIWSNMKEIWRKYEKIRTNYM